MKRSALFLREYRGPVLPAILAAGEALKAAIARVESFASDRRAATGTFRGAVQERLGHRRRLRAALSDLSRVAKTLDPLVYPDIAAHLKMGRLNGNAEFHAFAKNAIAVIAPMKGVFIAHGAAPSVIEDLQAMLDAFDASGQRRASGLGAQIRSNLALAEALREGMRQVHRLDAIFHLTLKGAPALFGHWRSAARQEQRHASNGSATERHADAPVLTVVPGANARGSGIEPGCPTPLASEGL